jgi:hypothetical protein
VHGVIFELEGSMSYSEIVLEIVLNLLKFAGNIFELVDVQISRYVSDLFRPCLEMSNLN